MLLGWLELELKNGKSGKWSLRKMSVLVGEPGLAFSRVRVVRTILR